MSRNSIPGRVAFFLKGYPPFSFLTEEEQIRIAHEISIRYCPKGEIVFTEGEKTQQVFFLLRQGQINIYKEENNQQQLLDVCDEGELFGIRALLAEDNYFATAEAKEESLLYEIPIAAFTPYMEQNARVSLYFAHDFAAGSSRISKQQAQTTETYLNLNAESSKASLFSYHQQLSSISSKSLISITADESLQAAAILMTHHEIGSLVVVNENQNPVGIITDTDFRKKIATQGIPLSESVNAVMSAPVACVSGQIGVSEAFLKMVQLGINHLVITEDGSDKSKAISIVSEHDLLLEQGNNPAVLVKQINRATHVEDLKVLREKVALLLEKNLKGGVGIAQVRKVISSLNDAILKRILKLTEKEFNIDPSAYCFVALGSEGREEQLLYTDQDNALILKDGEDTTLFEEFAHTINNKLHQVGFDFCPSEIMCRNPENRLTVKSWILRFSNWISAPEPKSLMNSTIFFDMRGLHGNFSLLEQLREGVLLLLSKHRGFLNFLANNALQNPPPLSFFKDFVVEKSGEHSNAFDIKARAMMPISDAARVLAYDEKYLDESGTIERLQWLSLHDEKHQSLLNEAIQAYRLLIRFRTLSGLENNDSGRYVNVNGLSKLDRQTLRSTFKTIDKLQTYLKSRYTLDLFRS